MSNDAEQRMQDQIEGGLIAQEEFEARVDKMVCRFLSMKLPEDFSPDGGVELDREYTNKFGMPYGTNLLNYDQAKAMVLNILAEAK